MQGTTPGARRRVRPRTAYMDNIKTWTGLPVEETIRMSENRDKWRKHVHGVDRERRKNRTEQNTLLDCTFGATLHLSSYLLNMSCH